MASFPTEVTFSHIPEELHVSPDDYSNMLTAYAIAYPGERFPIPIVADPDVPQGTIRGVGMVVFTDHLGHKTERRMMVTYKTEIPQTISPKKSETDPQP